MIEKDLENFKTILENQKSSLVKQLSLLQESKMRKENPLSKDFEDQAQEVEDDEVVDQLESIETKRLSEMEAALYRIESGLFGICVNCDKEIARSRLEALPFTDKCINCQ